MPVIRFDEDQGVGLSTKIVDQILARFGCVHRNIITLQIKAHGVPSVGIANDADMRIGQDLARRPNLVAQGKLPLIAWKHLVQAGPD